MIPGQSTVFPLSGFVRQLGESDDSLNRLAQKEGRKYLDQLHSDPRASSAALLQSAIAIDMPIALVGANFTDACREDHGPAAGVGVSVDRNWKRRFRITARSPPLTVCIRRLIRLSQDSKHFQRSEDQRLQHRIKISMPGCPACGGVPSVGPRESDLCYIPSLRPVCYNWWTELGSEDIWKRHPYGKRQWRWFRNGAGLTTDCSFRNSFRMLTLSLLLCNSSR